MKLAETIRRRVRRGFSPLSVGPNEARILYDAVLALGAWCAAAGFSLAFVAGRVDPWTLVMPPALMLANRALGIYTTLKHAPSRRKAVVLALATAVATAAGWLLSSSPHVAVLWGAFVLGPLVLPRLLLNLGYGRHRSFLVSAVRQRGPVVVLGGAGYIGSHVVELLLENGNAVRVLDRLMYGKEPLAEFGDHPDFELVKGDVTDVAKLTEVMRGASAVVHLAGLVGDPACAVDPDFTRHTNIIATRMAKDVAQSMGIWRFVFASSCSVYGSSEVEVREGDKLNPVSLYAQTKIDSEQELLLSARDDFFVTILRFATVFGHSRRPRFDLVANLFTAQAIVDGKITVLGPQQLRPFVHVRDLARAVLMTLEAPTAAVQGQVFNVGDSRLNTSILELARTVERVLGGEHDIEITVEDTPLDKRNYRVSFDKIRAELGFEAETTIEDGVREMADHFDAGTYHDFRGEEYSNVAMTTKALSEFYDPIESMSIYAPRGEKSASA